MRRVVAVILSFAAIGAYWQTGAQTKTSGTDGFQFVDKTGNIRKPTTFEIHTRIGRPYDVSFTKAILNWTGSNGC
jgi:hypothetical protein